ncbi:hypothetical protein A3L11_08950 [Thermococcus siculi]|uniref:Uncharacterized protein n=1 Tax=Thermococcus siculi TaxID=72803 RepID=A0A2Z2MZB2_9EURY|nr:hypothetical protein [Thermococcus siculi]ASJ09350.1 hypothetical protein A3L11_08950 [Thermococcus siculi]
MSEEDGPINLGDVKLLVRELFGYELTDRELKRDLIEWLTSRGMELDDVRVKKGRNFRYSLPPEFVEYELNLCKKRAERASLEKELYGEFPFSALHTGQIKELIDKFNLNPDHKLYPLVKAALEKALELRGPLAEAQLSIDYVCWGLSHSTRRSIKFRPTVIVTLKTGVFILARYSRGSIEIKTVENPFARLSIE